MLRRIHHRLTADDGVSLVELMVALFVITVAVFALLGSFIASAQSIQHQQTRSTATRLATEALEQARAAGFAELGLGVDEREVPVGGTTYVVTRTVEWSDADDPDAGANEHVKHVRATVAWNLRGTGRTLEFDTIVAPLEGPPQGIGADADPGIVAITMFPNPVNVDEEGEPVQDVGISVRLRHYPVTSFVEAQWLNDDETEEDVSLTYAGMNTWTASIPRSDIRFVPPDEEGDDTDGEEVPGITFTVRAWDGGEQEDIRTHKLKVQLLSGELPTFSTTSVTPNPVQVNDEHHVHGCGQGNSCTNDTAIDLTAVVENLENDEVDAVKVRWIRWGGGTGEIALRRDEANPSRWTETIPRRSDTFEPGENQFVFIATRASDQAEGTTSKTVTVVVK